MTHELIIEDNPAYTLTLIYQSRYERFTSAIVDIKGEYAAMFKLSESELRILATQENYDKLKEQMRIESENDAIQTRIDTMRGK